VTSQLRILKTIRKALPPARKVILDRKTKARRKRVKIVEPFQLSSRWNTL
jgi:hypothetical protein